MQLNYSEALEFDWAGTFPHPGVIKCGPFPKVNCKAALEALKACCLSMQMHDSVVVGMKTTQDGALLSAEGPGVLGYLISDEDGLEAPATDLERLGHLILPAKRGVQAVIKGYHQLSDRHILRCTTSLERNDRGVLVTRHYNDVRL